MMLNKRGMFRPLSLQLFDRPTMPNKNNDIKHDNNNNDNNDNSNNNHD